MPGEEDELTQEGERAIKSVAKGAGIVFVSVLFSRFAGYLYRVIVARFLGAEAYGIISLGMSLVGFAIPFCFLGLNSGIKRYVALYNGKDDEESTKGTILSGLKMITASSMAISVVLFLLSDFLAAAAFNEPAAGPVFKIFAISLLFYGPMKGIISTTDAFQNMKYRSISYYISRNAVKLIAVLLFFYIGLEILGAAYAYLLSYVVAFAVAFYFLMKKIVPEFRDVVPKPNYRELLAYSWPLLFVSIVGKILGHTDKIMLGYFLDSSSVGIYNSALPTAMLLGTGLYSIRKIILPVFSDLLGKEEEEELTRTFRVSTKWAIATTLPLFVVLVIFAPQVLDLVFGSEYVVGSTALSILAVAYFIKVCFGLGSSFLKAVDRTKQIFIATASAAVLNVTLNLLLIPRIGIEGAAYAYLFSIVLSYGLYMAWSYRYLQASPYKLSVIKFFISAVLSALPVYFLFRYILSPVRTWMLPVAFVLYLGLYTLLFLATKSLDKDDILVLKAVERKTGVRIEWLRSFIKKFI